MKPPSTSLWTKIVDNLGLDTPIGAIVFALVITICMAIIYLR